MARDGQVGKGIGKDTELVDGRGRRFRVDPDRSPRRIVSLVPSTTETLFALGAGERVVGVTRFCRHPADALAELPRVGGTKDVDPERVLALEPDLVFANVEENTREIVEALDARVPVWAAFPRTVDEAVADVRATGLLSGGDPAALAAWEAEVARARAALAARAPTPWTFAYLVWRRPWMAAGTDTFIAALLGLAGGRPVLDAPRYPTLDEADLRRADRVLLPDEPFRFRARHADEIAALGVPRDRIHLVDGELLCWHGTRMAAGLRYLHELAAGWG